MTETLSEKQQRFAVLVAKLILWAFEHGYGITFGEAYRTLEQAQLNEKKGSGILNSLHRQRLAVDLNLFANGKYQTDPEAYRPLGDYWKSLNLLCRYGGDFKSKDANHFSMEHEGLQ